MFLHGEWSPVPDRHRKAKATQEQVRAERACRFPHWKRPPRPEAQLANASCNQHAAIIQQCGRMDTSAYSHLASRCECAWRRIVNLGTHGSLPVASGD